MKKLPILSFLILLSNIGYGQTESETPKYDITRLDTNFNISVWGAEPSWNFDFKGTHATGHIMYNKSALMTFTLVQRIGNQGFTNEYVDTYTFESSTGEIITLILIRNNDCKCGYDMGEGESNTSAYLLTNFDNKPWMLLGCAHIIDRP